MCDGGDENSVGVSFDNGIDVYDSQPAVTVVSYGYPDGPTSGKPRDYPRHLHQFTNIGVAFDYSDDVTTRESTPIAGSLAPNVTNVVSQNFPDGDIVRDWARHLYQYLQVIEEEPIEGRLFIGPTSKRSTIYPPTKPPVSRVGSRGPEVV